MPPTFASKRFDPERPEAASWEWRLRAFLSADLIGSTACKNEALSEHEAPNWPFMFREFYADLPDRLAAAYVRQADVLREPAEPLTVWKTLGDEMIFSAVLRSRFEALAHAMAFKTAINDFNHEWRDKPVKLKPAMWVAGFPVQNTELTLPNSNGQSDFIGPSIDAGFRLTKYASQRRFVVSIESAVVLLAANRELGKKNVLHFFYEGKETLKGVDRDRPYPIVWIDLADNQDDLEDELKGRGVQKPANQDVLQTWLGTHIKHPASVGAMPFIEGDSVFGTIPDGMVKRRQKMIDAEATYRDDGGAAAAAAVVEPHALILPKPVVRPDEVRPTATQVKRSRGKSRRPGAR